MKYTALILVVPVHRINLSEMSTLFNWKLHLNNGKLIANLSFYTWKTSSNLKADTAFSSLGNALRLSLSELSGWKLLNRNRRVSSRSKRAFIEQQSFNFSASRRNKISNRPSLTFLVIKARVNIAGHGEERSSNYPSGGARRPPFFFFN